MPSFSAFTDVSASVRKCPPLRQSSTIPSNSSRVISPLATRYANRPASSWSPNRSIGNSSAPFSVNRLSFVRALMAPSTSETYSASLACGVVSISCGASAARDSTTGVSFSTPGCNTISFLPSFNVTIDPRFSSSARRSAVFVSSGLYRMGMPPRFIPLCGVSPAFATFACASGTGTICRRETFSTFSGDVGGSGSAGSGGISSPFFCHNPVRIAICPSLSASVCDIVPFETRYAFLPAAT